MNSAYTVGAVFTIENLASPQIGKIAGEMKELAEQTKGLQASLETLHLPKTLIDGLLAAQDGLGKLDTTAKASADSMAAAMGGAFEKIDASAETSFKALTAGFGRLDVAANASIANITRLSAELKSLQIAVPHVGRNAMGHAASRGGNADNGGFHFNSHERIGPVSGSGKAGLAIGGAVMVGDAVYEAATLEDIVTKVLITSQMNPGESPLSRNKDGAKIADLIKRGAVISGESIASVGDMFLGTEREFQGFTFDKKLETMNQMLPAIAAEAHLRHESLEEAGKSMIGVLHQSGLFTQEEMAKGSREFQFTTMATPVGLDQFGNALSYAMPLHNQIGMDTGTIMLMTALMQSSGIKNSKSGTWLDAMFAKAQPDTDVLGPLKKEQIQHNNALKMLGLVGADGKQNWHVMGADGKEDWNASAIRFGQILHTGQEKIPEAERNDVLEKAFGKQGGRAASLFSQDNILDQLKILAAKEKAFVGGDVSLSEYNAGSTVQQFRIAEQEFQTSMATLGTQLLPTVNSALKGFSEILERLPADWEATKKMWSFPSGPNNAPLTPAQKAWLLQHPGGTLPDDLNPSLLRELRPKGTEQFGPNLPDGSAPDSSGGGHWWSGLFHKTAFEDGSIGGVSSAEDIVYRGTLRAFTDFAAGRGIGGSGGDSGGGGGFTNASYTTFGDGGSSGGRFGFSGRNGGGGAGLGLTALGHGAVSGTLLSRGDDAMAHLMSMGVSREAAAAIVGNAQQESSISGHGPMGDHGTAGGMFQWRFERLSALKAFAAARGKDWRDEHTELDFMVQEAKQRGNAGWLYGHDVYAANQGMQRFELYGESRDHGNFRTRLGNANMWNGRAGQAATSETHVHVHLDGKQITKSVVKTMASNMRYPRSVGGVDHGNHYSNDSGTPASDSA